MQALLRRSFRPEFLNRLDEIILFKPLTRENLTGIIDILMESLRRRLSEKLLKLEVDLGYEKRRVVSGIAKFYKPEDLIGKKVIMVANLAPRVMNGEESNGMVLATGESDVKVLFAADDAEIGDRVC